MTDLLRDALAAGQAIANGETTAEKLTEAALARIEEREEAVRAWKHLDPDRALAEARDRDAGPSKGPLHGVPVAVKDVIDTGDQPTGYGSPIHEGNRPVADAACVALLRRAGMVVIGKTVTTEFAMRHPGATRNPHNPDHTPGGSSSGSAAAVGAGMVPLGIGTQTAGSIIRPASYCGVWGFKPTYGSIPRGGLKMLAESLDTIGAMAHSARDALAFVRIMGGFPIDLPDALTKPPRLGLCRSPAWREIEPGGEAALEEAATRVRAAGGEVVEVDLPSPFEECLEAHDAIMPFEAARLLAWERSTRPDRLSAAITEVIESGERTTVEAYRYARVVQAACRASLPSLLEDVDAILTPAAPGEAPRGLEWTGNPAFNRIWTTVGVPCVTVPGLFGPGGLPIGSQIVGPFGDDGRTIATAEWLATALAS